MLGRRTRATLDESDAANETLLKARIHKGAKQLESRSEQRLWLWTILRNLIISTARREDWRLEWGEWASGRATASGSGPSSAAQKTEEIRNARQLLNALPERDREVVRLRVEEDLTFADVARRLEMTENHARVLFHRSLKTLRARANRDGPLDG